MTALGPHYSNRFSKEAFRFMLKQTMKLGAMLAMAIGAVAPTAATTLNGAGSTFVFPMMTKWSSVYHNAHPDVDFNYQPVGSGAGIAQYKAGTVDFGATDAPLSDDDLKSMPHPTFCLPVVSGAEVLSYHLAGVGPGLRLSGPVIADIYLGNIKTWNDPRIQKLNPFIKLPGDAITVVHRSDGSGTTYIFTNYLASVSEEWRTKVGAGKAVNWPVGLGGQGNAGVAGMVQQSPGAIGYVELAYAVDNHLPYGPVRNSAGNYVLASVTSAVAAATACSKVLAHDARAQIVNAPGVNSYPIVGFTYILVPRNMDSEKGTALKGFLRWALGESGQNMAETLYYAPLPGSLQSYAKKLLK